MVLNKCFGILLLCTLAYSVVRVARIEVLYDLSLLGSPVLRNAMNLQTQELQNAVDAQKPIDAACDLKKHPANTTCANCVDRKCNAKKNSCPNPGPPGIPNFFTNVVPSTAQVAGNRILSVQSNVQNRVGVIGGVIRRTGERVSIEIGQKFKAATDAAVAIAENAGKKIISFGGDAVNSLSNLANDIKNFFEGLGKRRRSLNLVKRSTTSTATARPTIPPSCSSLQSSNAGCAYYSGPSICSTCVFNSETECNGWKAANDRVTVETADAKWLEDNEDNKEYGIERITYDTRSYDFDTGGYKDSEVTVSLFGLRYRFTITETLDFAAQETANATAGVIVRYTIAAAKLSKASASG